MSYKTTITVEHEIPVGARVQARSGTRPGQITGIELRPLGVCYVVEYDDAPGEVHYWPLRHGEDTWRIIATEVKP